MLSAQLDSPSLRETAAAIRETSAAQVSMFS